MINFFLHNTFVEQFIQRLYPFTEHTFEKKLRQNYVEEYNKLSHINHMYAFYVVIGINFCLYLEYSSFVSFLTTYFAATVITFFLLLIGFFSYMESRLLLTTLVNVTSFLFMYITFPISSIYNPFTFLLFLPLIFSALLNFVKSAKENLFSMEKFYVYLHYYLLNFGIVYIGMLLLLVFLFVHQRVFSELNVLHLFNAVTLDGFFLIMTFPTFSNILPFNCIFGIDGVAIVFLFLTHLLITLCLFFLWSTMRNDTNFILYISQLLVLSTQLQLTFTALDILTFFLAFESLLIPMIILIALWGSKNNRQANNYLIFYTMVSAIPMLLAILYLKFKLGFTSLIELKYVLYQLTTIEKMMVWLSFFFAFAVKTPMVPVHIWLPKTHVDAPTVGSVILAGVLLKVGLIGMIRFLFPLFPTLTHFFAPYITAMATIGVIYASLITLRQIDAKRIIAYSSVAHMNMAMVSLCSLNYVGLYSTIYLMVSHGLIASGLFFLVGFLYNRFHVRSIYYYSGLATCMPYFAIYFFLFTLANMAFPLTSGFIGEFLLLLGITLNNFYLGFLNSLSMLLTTVYSVLLFSRVFLGELKVWLEQIVLKHIHLTIYNNDNKLQEVTTFDLNSDERIIVEVLFAYILLLGIYPELLFVLFDKGSFLMLTVFMV